MRNPARRVFSVEFEDATHEFRDDNEGEENDDKDQSSKYLLAPTGRRMNRVAIAGTVMEVRSNDSDTYVRCRVADPTGAFFVSAGEYRPDSPDKFAAVEPPAYIWVTGRAWTPDSEAVLTSVSPECVVTIDGAQRARWAAAPAVRTLRRAQAYQGNREPEDEDHGSDIEMAKTIYGDAVEVYKQRALEALGSNFSDGCPLVGLPKYATHARQAAPPQAVGGMGIDLPALQGAPHLIFVPGMHRTPVVDVASVPNAVTEIGFVWFEGCVVGAGGGLVGTLTSDEQGALPTETFLVA